MESIYKPGQILYIKSSMGPWCYISVLRYATPVERMGNTYELHTCCDLCVDVDGICLTFARGNGSLLDFDTSFALVKAFKDYDLGWDKHFTDSSYFDILDWLSCEFVVDLDANQNTPLGETINEIQNYIWDALCEETGNYQACTDYVEPEMVNKQEFIELVIEWVKNRDNVEKYLHIQTSLIDGFADALRKYLEERL